MNIPTLATERLHLRGLTEPDIPALFAIFSDPAVMRYWSFAPLTDLAAVTRLLDGMTANAARGDMLPWGVERLDQPGIIGTVTLRDISLSNERAEVGFSLASACHGRGLAAEAVAAVLRYAFGPLALYRIEADVDPRNAASLRLLERLGFQREGLLRSRWFVGGERCDSVMLGLHRDEWSGGARQRPA